MLRANIPAKFPIAFASNAPGSNITNPIPTASQTGGHASLNDGFPPVNSVPIAGGGIPPWGVDENGIHFMETAALQWGQAGAIWPYDATFQSAIGGYPQDAVVGSAVFSGRFWISTVDNNLTNPDSGGAGWIQRGSYITSQFSGPGSYTYTVPPYCNQMWAEIWGGGGGASGGPVGASGAGGGYASGWFSVAPGQVLNLVIGAGGGGSNNLLAAPGGITSIASGMTTYMQAQGGSPGGSGPGPGGNGIGGALNISGQAGHDLGASTSTEAPGGNAPRGGMGGNSLNAPGALGPTWPGGGGAASTSVPLGQDGAPGGAFIAFRVG